VFEKFSVRGKVREKKSEIILYDNTACDGFQHFMPFIKIVREGKKAPKVVHIIFFLADEGKL
jgi:hypothetical protein